MDFLIATFPFFYFLFIGAITPGPNNVMLAASGMNFGYIRTLPHVLGIFAGFLTLLLLSAFGLGSLYKAYPEAQIVLKILGSLYLVYLAYLILRSGRVGLTEKSEETGRPLYFLEGFAFQFINPKAVVYAMAAISLLPTWLSAFETVLVILIVETIAFGISFNVWVLFGKLVAELFRDDKIRLVINIILAALLIATIPMMVM